MGRLPKQLDVLLDVLVEAALRELDAEKENADGSEQEQRRRGDQAIGILHDDNITADPRPR